MRVRGVGGKHEGLQKLNHHGNFNNIPAPLHHHHRHRQPFCKRAHERKLVSKRRSRFNRHLFLTPAKQQRHHWLDKDLVTVLLRCIILQHRKARRCENANGSQVLAASNNRTLWKYLYAHSNPILSRCSRLYVTVSLQFCLKRHPGNLEKLSKAAGPNLTGMWLQQRDLLYESPTEESHIAEDLPISYSLWNL